MTKYWSVLVFLVSILRGAAADPTIAEYRTAADQFIVAATNSHFAFDRLTYFCDTFGHRFSGTPSLEKSIDWILAEMKKDGLENVRGEEVMVPRWVRGEESAELIRPYRQQLPMLGLGGSVGTPAKGITAEVFVVKSFDDLKQNAEKAKGKIVLFNQPFTEYSKTVLIRSRGAMEAAKAGAVASLVRSVTPMSLQTPHTGNMRYTDEFPKIPHAAITVEDAELMQRMQDRGEKIVVQLKMQAKTLANVPSRNVVGEIRGREKPEEVVIVSGHIDSWDVGQGAMDDAGGCVAAWEAVRLMHKLGLRPRRTVRVVMWTNEENGINGAKGYVERHRNELENHILAIESDEGTFKPSGFAFAGSQKGREIVTGIGSLLKGIEAGEIAGEAGGADVSKLHEQGVPIMDLRVDGTKYFWYHHTSADTMDKLDRHEVNLCTATLAIMAYVVADLPASLPRD